MKWIHIHIFCKSEGESNSMNIVICGGTGLVGCALTKSLLNDGHTVKIITRKPMAGHEASPRLQYMSWNELKQKPESLEGIDVAINLAGETLNQRWTDKSKQRILQSRLLSVAKLAQALNALQKSRKLSFRLRLSPPTVHLLLKRSMKPARAVRKTFCLKWSSSGRRPPTPTLPMPG